MKITMEIADAQIQQKGKGEDDCLVRALDDEGMVQLLAVADGLSLSGGKAAAQWTIKCLKQLAGDRTKQPADVDSPRSIYRAIKRALADAQQDEQSETTLTCGILRQLTNENETFLRFEYFAIGDSPIWKVIPGDSKYPFQRVLVHGALYPAETAKVYSTLRLHKKDIIGSIAFGVTEVAVGEVLVVCTDGIPEREVFIRDFTPPEEGNRRKAGLCDWLFQERKYKKKNLKEVLARYDELGILFDDATIIAARLGPASIALKDQIATSVEYLEPESTTVPQESNSNRMVRMDDVDSSNLGELRSAKDNSSIDGQAQLASVENIEHSCRGSADKSKFDPENLKPPFSTV